MTLPEHVRAAAFAGTCLVIELAAIAADRALAPYAVLRKLRPNRNWPE